ncbi:hydrolase [Oscillochloris trichoides DG-6]|uniref:Hydrolase n=1 Tax=Oscillochloris trichoides DG-6 TaxID=765420 RepID=E1IDZ8_9CHLR|nr:amidase family protein [Oscillochloris trichoides]EFO80609.1 hydrolase [Oscillochloris trichoides DG-6]
MAPFSDYPNYDALGLADLVRTRQVTPLELVEAAICQITEHNPALNAVIFALFDQARATAQAPLPDGPFAGVPMLLKDFWATCAGVPTSDGNAMLRHFPRPRDSEMVRRWKASGAIILGKTNVPEFALQPTTEPAAFGPTRNPWDLRRSPAGSSGGSAAAVASRMVPIASATDGGGSIRMPAACCGLFGLKVSRGRTPSGPDQGEMWSGLGVEHVITRTVRDSAAMLDATAGMDVGAPYAAPEPQRPFLEEVTCEPGRLRIAFTDHPFFGHAVHPECRAGVRATARLLESLGHEVVEDAPRIDGAACAKAMLILVAAEVRAALVEAALLAGRRPNPEDFETATYAMGLLGKSYSLQAYMGAWRRIRQTTREVGQFFTYYDALLTPTLAQPPLLLGHFDLTPPQALLLRVANRMGAGWLLRSLAVPHQIAKQLYDYMPYTPLFNLTGQPAMSVPLIWSGDGLPIGMQFAARYGDEATLFRLAGQLERARPWAQRRPLL